MKICSKCHIEYPLSSFTQGGWCRDCRLAHSREYNHRPGNMSRIVEKTRLKRKENRINVVNKYGGKCTCCGEHRYEFLTIDHVNGDGAEERKTYQPNREGARSRGTTHEFVARLNREPISDRYQILCHNCNQAKHIYNVCPHTTQQ